MNNNDFYNIDDSFKSSDLRLAALENFGASLNSIGYLLISISAKTEYRNLIRDEESFPSPIELLIKGQLLILLGYYILWLVANNRVISEELKESNVVSSHKKIEASYLISIFANALRLEAFFEIFQDETIE